jgi:hypothetical protein
VADVVDMVRVLVNNTFIQNGGVIKQQTLGIPISTNPAPHLADLTCYAHEARMIDYLMRTDNINIAGVLWEFSGTLMTF